MGALWYSTAWFIVFFVSSGFYPVGKFRGFEKRGEDRLFIVGVGFYPVGKFAGVEEHGMLRLFTADVGFYPLGKLAGVEEHGTLGLITLDNGFLPPRSITNTLYSPQSRYPDEPTRSAPIGSLRLSR